MRRLALVVTLVYQSVAWPPANAASQTDAVGALLTRLQSALRSGRVAEFVAADAQSLTAAQRAWLTAIVPPSGASEVSIRERMRSASTVLADVFVAHGNRGFVASWRLELAHNASDDRIGLRSIAEISRFQNLLKLELDESRQFTVKDFVVTGPDFTMTLPSGTAFQVEVPGGVTAFVLQGRATIRFTPSDPAEQGQLRIFAGAPAFTTQTDDAFVRVNPRDLHRHVSWNALQPVSVNAGARTRARRVFEDRAGQSYYFDLGDLDADRWSLEPVEASVLVDFRTGRHGWLTYARSPNDPEDVALFNRERQRQISLYASAKDVSGPNADFDDDNEAYEVRRTALDLNFDPSRRWLSGRASITLAVRRPVSSFTFKLADPLDVSSVSSPELGPLLALRAPGYNSLLVGVPVELPAGKVVTIEVQYHGRLESQTLDHDGAIGANGTPEPDFVFPVEPSFLYSNRSWWYPHPASPRHAQASIRLTIPADYRAVATGELLSDTVTSLYGRGDGSSRQVRTLEFRTERPVRYLSCLISKLEPVGRAQARVPAVAGHGPNDAGRSADTVIVDVNVMAGPGQSRRTRVTPDRVASIVSFYADTIGEAPYPSLTVAALTSTRPGGHSPAFFALINQPYAATPISWSRDPVAFADAPDYFLAHEIAHQWWGQAVAGRNYHEQWISEGFAQYFAWLYVASTSADVGQRLMSRMRATSAGLAAEGPIHLGYRLGHLRDDPRVFRSIVYNKSAVVLHMLQRLIGDDAFFAGLRRLYAAGRFGTVGLDDVRQAFQADMSMPLDRFFTRWIREAALPQLRFTWSPTTSGDIRIGVQQIGDTFDLPYDVTLHYADGRREIVTLRITDASAEFAVTPRAQVRRVEFNDALTLAEVVR